MVTQSQVAKRAGVSFITVSRVINNKGNVKEETRERVLAAIRELGYHPNSAGRALNSNQQFVLGFSLQNDVRNVFVTDVLAGLQGVCRERGYQLLLSFPANGSETVDPLQPYFERRVDGLIFLHTDLSDSDLTAVEKNAIPCAMLWGNCDHPTLISVHPDDRCGGRMATQHLIDHGHERIAHIGGLAGSRSAQDRQAAYETTIREAGLPVPPDYILGGGFDVETGYAMIETLMTLDSPPTAVFCANDLIAIGAWRRLDELGLSVPDDVSLIGFDDCSYTQSVGPLLNTIRVPIADVSATGARAVIDRIEGIGTPTEFNDFDLQLIERKSVSTPRT